MNCVLIANAIFTTHVIGVCAIIRYCKKFNVNDAIRGDESLAHRVVTDIFCVIFARRFFIGFNGKRYIF